MKRVCRIGGALMGAALVFLEVWPVARAGEKHRVTIEKFAFVPATLTINRGDTVEFVNADPAPHTATGDGAPWDTGELGKGQSARIGFKDAGTFPYRCEFHPHMRAAIVVKPN